VWYWMRRKAAISGWRTGTRWFKYDRDWFLCKQATYVPVIFEPPCTIISNEFICFEVIVTDYSKTIHKCRLHWQGNCTFIWQSVVTINESNISSSGGHPTPFKVFHKAISMHLPRFYFRLAAVELRVKLSASEMCSDSPCFCTCSVLWKHRPVIQVLQGFLYRTLRHLLDYSGPNCLQIL